MTTTLKTLTVTEAVDLLEEFTCHHTRDVRVRDGEYWADFNIKVYNCWRPDNAAQAAYLEGVFWHLMSWELENVRVAAREIGAIACQQTGHSGGWLSCKLGYEPDVEGYTDPELSIWEQREIGEEIIALAQKVRAIADLCKTSVEYLKTEEFWQGELDANYQATG